MRLWKISGMKCSRFHSTRIDGSPIAPAEWPLARSVALGIHVPDEEVDVEFPDGSRRTIRMSAAPVRSHTVGDPDYRRCWRSQSTLRTNVVRETRSCRFEQLREKMVPWLIFHTASLSLRQLLAAERSATASE